MGRTYKLKPKKYSEEDLEKAMKSVLDDNVSLRSAALRFGIDKSLLSRRIHGKGNRQRGRKTALTLQQEQELANSLKIMSKWGFALTKKETLASVQMFVEQNELDVPFKNGMPGHDWFMSFCNRHKLSLKKAQPMEMSRMKATSDPFIIYEFYDILEETIRLLDLADKPHLIFNLDETSFSADPSKARAVSERGKKVHRAIQGSGKDNTTVLACCAASGKLLPPLIIFQGVTLWTSWKGTKDLKGTFYACSERGWMTSTIFEEYFERMCRSIKERPFLIVLDGHLTHLSQVTVELALKENVTILKLPSHTTDVLQPLDVSGFKPLKVKWEESLIEWQRTNMRRLSKSEFCNLLCSIWHEGLSKSTIMSGFKKTGIFPTNRAKYPVHRLNTLKLEAYNDEKNRAAVNGNIVMGNVVPEANLGVPQIAVEHVTPQMHDTQDQEVLAVPSTSKVSPFPSTAAVTPPKPENSSFEDILLSRIKRTDAPATKRRKVDVRSKLISTEEFLVSIAESESKKKGGKSKALKSKKKSSESDKPKSLESDKPLLSDIEDEPDKEESEEEIVEDIEMEDPTGVQEGDFVLVAFEGKGKRNAFTYKYVAIVQRVLTEFDISIMCMNHVGNNLKKTLFKVNDRDVSCVSNSTIIGKLPIPKVILCGERVQYEFANHVPVFEKK